MTERNWRIVASALAVVLAVLGGIAVASLIIPGGGGSSPSTPASVALGSILPSALPSASPSSASPNPSPTPSPSPSPTPSPTPPPAPLATLTFTQLKLDSKTDPAHQERIVTFTSDGPGTIKAKLVSVSPQGTTHMCIRAGTHDLGCKDWANGTITAKTTSAHVNWRVTLLGNAIATPLVDLTVSFPALTPSVKITNARFDGTSLPDTNGIQAIFVPRAPGNAHVVASWGSHPFQWELDATNMTSGAGNVSMTNQAAATRIDQTFPVTNGETWKVLLQNIELGLGPTGMTFTISWP